MTHTMQHNVIGEVIYDEPWVWTFVYPDGQHTTFFGVMRMTAMKTGCYILDIKDGTKVVVAPGHRHVIQEREDHYGKA